VQDEGARHVAEAALAAGAKMFLHVSAIGADPKSPSVYGRTKAAGEEAVRDTFPEAMIVRPSIVFGPEDQFFNRFAALARLFPALPLIGAETKFQPVFVGDVAKAIVAALRGNTSEGATLELGGPEILTMREVLERVMTYTMRKRWLVPVPFPLAKLQGALLQFLPNPPLTLDQVRLLQKDNVISEEARRDGRTLEGLGIDPVAIDAAVPDYLEQYRPKGQFSDYRPS
jgi:NADH dehydrogenase